MTGQAVARVTWRGDLAGEYFSSPYIRYNYRPRQTAIAPGHTSTARAEPIFELSAVFQPGVDAMTSSERSADSSRPIQTMSMAEFKALVDGTKKNTPADLPPALSDFQRQYEVDTLKKAAIRPIKSE